MIETKHAFPRVLGVSVNISLPFITSDVVQGKKKKTLKSFSRYYLEIEKIIMELY